MSRTQFSRNTGNPAVLDWLCTLISQIGRFAFKLLWRVVHFIVSICFAVIGVVDVVDSHLISSGLLKRYNVKSLRRPRYLAIVMDSEEARQISKVIQLLQWLADIGVKNVCLYDEEGTLRKSKDIIMEKLSCVRLFEEAYDADESNMSLEFASQYDGKDAVARAANLLLMKQMKMRNMGEHEDDKIFTEAQMSEALRDVGCRGPEPELLLVYGPVRCHLGFPAWRLRYTEIVHMGPLNSMRYGSLVKAVYEYSLVCQNYGK